ncbi:MAG: preprotein translocase subunit SecA [Deltaproteobacteria bacterium]|nr:preprotein translocase subunit SecA [Deltaproteobacteria bacterium]
MLTALLHKVFGSKNDRELKKIRPLVAKTHECEAELSRLSMDGLREKTHAFQARIRAATQELRAHFGEVQKRALSDELRGEESREEREQWKEEADALEKDLRKAEAEVLNEILPEAFAIVREVSRRVTGMRHFDSQILGGIVLHQGKIAEMKTGEGKTLVATLPIYLNALLGRGVHLITVNDYLARRDVQWMGPIYHALGLSVASIVHDTSFLFDPTYIVKDYRYINLRPIDRKDAYAADITYGTNNEFGFDYLRDNMKFSLDDYVQRELHFAIVDEVDNILIDEARTPLIISGPAEESTDKYYALDRVIPRLQKEADFTIDEKLRAVTLTEGGIAKVERILGVKNLYDPSEIATLHHVNQALKAHAIFKRDVDYVVKDGEVLIVDEFTGRLMPGRRWSDGLHQAVEAKEKVRIREENQTLATVTIQNYFRMYKKLSGMTGTADTEAVEFKKIYTLDVVVIPPNKAMARDDAPDVVYKTEREKFNAAIEDIAECHGRGQPVLVGTVSVEKSEHLGKLLKRKGIKHSVLNAVNHEAEANIIAQAGRFGVVTIATNMAGRGTDILLGGNPEFLARAEIEKLWLNNKVNAASPSATPTNKSYEESLEELRAEYTEAVSRAKLQYEKEWLPFEEARNAALKRMTETYRPFLYASWQKARTDYEQMAGQVDLTNGAREDAARMRQYRQTCVAYEVAISEYDKVIGPTLTEDQQQEYDAAREEYADLFAEGRHLAEAEHRSVVRNRYERVVADYTRAIARVAEGVVSKNGEVERVYQEARLAYEDAAQAYEQAEAAYEEKHRPYEEAVAAVEHGYEESRRERVKVVEEVREQFEKSPDLYKQQFDDVLEKYKKICAEEREKVVAAGGLHILGTERHEARRIDNQLRGRAGRQGDPGTSRFYLSLEDDLLRIFGAERVQKIMERLGMEEGEPIEHGLVTRAIENAQKRVEAHNFDIRKHLLEYDDVMNKQREIIYQQRRSFLAGENLKSEVVEMIETLAAEIGASFANREVFPEEWDWKGLDDALFRQFNLRLTLGEEEKKEFSPEKLEDLVLGAVRQVYESREQSFTPPVLRYLEKMILLQTIDGLWKDHLLSMDHLKEGIGLRGYGQKNPLQEYQKEAFAMFEGLLERMQADVVEKLFTVQIARQEDAQRIEQPRRLPQRQVLVSHGGQVAAQVTPQQNPGRKDQPKVGRNDLCPCGSGKKYKKCHGT